MKKVAKNFKKKAAIYVRQSTKEQQSLSQQEEDLERFCQHQGFIVVRKFQDKDSGTKIDRSGYQDLLKFMWQGKADVVVVWSLDRFGRSMNEMVKRMVDFDERGIDIVSYHQQIDTTKPMGRAIFGIFAAMAEIEAENIRRRVTRGMENAKKNGTKSGKPIGRPTVAQKDDVDLRECVRLIDRMQTEDDTTLMPHHIQKQTGVSRSSYYRVEKIVTAVREHEDEPLSLDELREASGAGKRLCQQVQKFYNDLLIEA